MGGCGDVRMYTPSPSLAGRRLEWGPSSTPTISLTDRRILLLPPRNSVGDEPAGARAWTHRLYASSPRAGLFFFALGRRRILRSRLRRTACTLMRAGVPGRGATWSNRRVLAAARIARMRARLRAGLFFFAFGRRRILRSMLLRTANALMRVGVPGRMRPGRTGGFSKYRAESQIKNATQGWRFLFGVPCGIRTRVPTVKG